MQGDDFGQLIYLVLLGTVIASYVFVSFRKNIGEAARTMALWAFIIIGVAVSYGLWNDISGAIVPRQSVMMEEGRIEAPLREDGHYYLTLTLDGTPVEFVVDTGASEVVLSGDDARRIGIDPGTLAYTGRASTANGVVRTAPVMIEDVRIGDFEDGRLRVLVNEGELSTSLLGMSYLQRYDSIEIRNNRLILQR